MLEWITDLLAGWWNTLRGKRWELTDKPVEGPLHVYPLRDLVAHELDDDCPCGPRAEPAERGDGSLGFVMVHHALDGRR